MNRDLYLGKLLQLFPLFELTILKQLLFTYSCNQYLLVTVFFITIPTYPLAIKVKNNKWSTTGR